MSENPLHYRIIRKNPQAHLLSFQLVIDNITTKKLTLKLPLWRPGRYERQNFAQNVYKVTAKDEKDHQRPCFKKDTNTWEIAVDGANQITVLYDYFAAQMDAGGMWFDENQLYINWIACVFQVEEYKDLAYIIELDLPNSYQVATSLGRVNQQDFVLKAEHFLELIDSPVMASPTLKKYQYTVENYQFFLWFETDVAIPWERVKQDFVAFTKAQITFFGGFPTQEYHFLFQLLPYKAYHGVEHRNSTVITLGRSEEFEDSLYNHFLGISSHELFHTWNVTRLRPVDFIPYNVHEPCYFETGFILEGITTFYGDYMLYKAEVWTLDQYIDELNTLFKRYFTVLGDTNYSLVESSIDLWVDGYKAGIPNRKVSIYVKGAIVALLLLLKIRQLTNNKKSLDDVVQSMWKRFGVHEIGYKMSDFYQAVNETAEEDLTHFIDDLVKGLVPIEPLLEELLPSVGLGLSKKESNYWWEKHFGFSLANTKDALTIASIAPNSPAWNDLSVHDEIVAINNKKATHKNFERLFNENENEVEVTLFRNHLLKHIELEIATNQTFFFTFEIDKNNSTVTL